MEEDSPSCSKHEADPSNNEELTELKLENGINVWGTNQQALEQLAEEELQIFSHNRISTNPLEDGELNEKTIPKQLGSTASSTLDINSYIKRQEELRKIQEYRKTLDVENGVSSISRYAAERISKQQAQKNKKRRNTSDKLDKIEDRLCSKPNSSKACTHSDSDFVPSDNDSDDEYEPRIKKPKRVIDPTSNSKCKVKPLLDDGNMVNYKKRLEQHYANLESGDNVDQDLEFEYYTIKGGLKILFSIWNKLYSYQQDGVRWMWKIHQQTTGGILGDEMGLGKTVQVIAFLAGLQYSQVVSKGGFTGLGPSIVVCPATVIHQWLNHFHQWAPDFRVAILHQSGSYQGNMNNLIRDMNQAGGILITSYYGVMKHSECLQKYYWHYLILDEGHKIRNPQAKVTKAVKRIRTPYKLMLTGSPMQNNLLELWSLFDFTNPGMLGSVQTFSEHFNNPIVQGGLANTTPMQEATALSVATTLKELITPFLLRRTKNEVQSSICLPGKTEQVLFCSLTEEQRDLYKGYLMTDNVGSIMDKDAKNLMFDGRTRAKILVGITTLRKICNHPDIYLTQANGTDNEDDGSGEANAQCGYYKRSGKMIVVAALLRIWKKQKHRSLLFSQSRSMILIFENFLKQQGYKYLKMDGGTSVTSRQPLINKFNEDQSYDVFLLTTRVGGLGINLTGADRVIIFDPDWNPATDIQARERAWRIGQDKNVTVYRLLSAGTIEEKMYQRQVWKQLLCNKVLIDPRTHRFFKNSNVHDLFSLTEDANPETTNIFRDSRIKIEETMRSKKNKSENASQFSESKLREMKEKAQQIAKSLNKEPPLKSLDQLEFEEERSKKRQHKEQLKLLTGVELLYHNRAKTTEQPKVVTNKLDDSETAMSFETALNTSQDNALKYQALRSEPLKSLLAMEEKVRKDKSKVDRSGRIDGELIDGLVRRETQKVKSEGAKLARESQDQYVLEKLFTKGVSGALHHDSIVDGGIKRTSLRVQCEAKLKADKALEALRKSRVDQWRW